MPNVKGLPTEAEEQSSLFLWANYIPELEDMFAIPNGGSRNKIEAANLRRQGVKAGVSDVFLPLPCGDYHGLWIEMKVKPNTPTQKQREFLEHMARNGYAAHVCYSFDEAREIIERYLKLKNHNGGEIVHVENNI